MALGGAKSAGLAPPGHHAVGDGFGEWQAKEHGLHAPATASAPATPMGPDPETEAWAIIRDTTDPRDCTDFLAAYPASRFAVAARLRLRQLRWQQPAASPPATPETQHPPKVGQQRRAPTSKASPLAWPQMLQAQRRLQEAGFAPGPIDGLFGPRTAAALRRYQARYGLPVTGMLDAATQHALRISNVGFQ
jgi:hypothetical protein